MANNTTSSINFESGGYDVEVICEYPSEFCCGVCTLFIKEAVHGCTNHVFCKSCLQSYIECSAR